MSVTKALVEADHLGDLNDRTRSAYTDDTVNQDVLIVFKRMNQYRRDGLCLLVRYELLFRKEPSGFLRIKKLKRVPLGKDVLRRFWRYVTRIGDLYCDGIDRRQTMVTLAKVCP